MKFFIWNLDLDSAWIKKSFGLNNKLRDIFKWYIKRCISFLFCNPFNWFQFIVLARFNEKHSIDFFLINWLVRRLICDVFDLLKVTISNRLSSMDSYKLIIVETSQNSRLWLKLSSCMRNTRHQSFYSASIYQ